MSKSKIFLISDLHIGHDNSIRFDERPFKDTHEMNEELVKRWNRVVRKNDDVYILGDMFHRYGHAKEYVSRLNGKKHLIVGNHDKVITNHADIHNQFDSVSPYTEINVDGLMVILSHYPIVNYNKSMSDKSIHFYGHVHKTFEYDGVLEAQQYARNRFIINAMENNRDESIHDLSYAMLNVGCMMPWMDYTPQEINVLIEVAKEVTRKGHL